MTKKQKQEIADAIQFALEEISRVNKAAGRTIFNPGATETLRDVYGKLGV